MQRLLTITMIILLGLTYLAARHLETQRLALKADLAILQQQLTDLEADLAINRALLDEAARRLRTDAELLEQLRQWLDTWQIEAYEATAYAPFDSPIYGLCHDGNPSITAAGTLPPPVPSQSIRGTFLTARPSGWKGMAGAWPWTRAPPYAAHPSAWIFFSIPAKLPWPGAGAPCGWYCPARG